MKIGKILGYILLTLVIVAAVTSPPAAVAASMSRLENIVFRSSG